MVTIAEVREKAKRQLEEARRPKDDLLGKILGGLGSGALAYLTGGLANAAIGGLAGAGIPAVSGVAQAAQGIGSGISGAASAVPGAKEVLSAAPGAAETGPAWFKPGSETLLSALEAGGKGFMDPSKTADIGIAAGLEEPISTARSNIKQTAVRETAAKLGLTPNTYGKDGATYSRPEKLDQLTPYQQEQIALRKKALEQQAGKNKDFSWNPAPNPATKEFQKEIPTYATYQEFKKDFNQYKKEMAKKGVNTDFILGEALRYFQFEKKSTPALPFVMMGGDL